MSDVTRKPGGVPAEPDRQTPDARGGTTPDPLRGGTTPDPVRGRTAPDPVRGGTASDPDRTDDAYPVPGARADHAAGTRADVTPGLRTDGPGTPGGTTADTGGAGSATTEGVHDEALLAHEECDRLGQRLHHAVAGFVDAPRASVEEADRVLEELTARFTDAVAQRRRTLRTSWRDTDADDRATSTDTEQLRLALRDYRELADRLMRV
ncbi:hypothetical protein [Streptomyces sp. BK79]|uniref:hypothetical protein n=1 Tax=Streptomyces sp. BK79 TaxID=3350097 RepID=UPI00376F9D74